MDKAFCILMIAFRTFKPAKINPEVCMLSIMIFYSVISVRIRLFSFAVESLERTQRCRQKQTQKTAQEQQMKKLQQCARLLHRRSSQCTSRYNNIAAALQSKPNETNRENNLRNSKKMIAALEL
jgi:hypothetical protein